MWTSSPYSSPTPGIKTKNTANHPALPTKTYNTAPSPLPTPEQRKPPAKTPPRRKTPAPSPPASRSRSHSPTSTPCPTPIPPVTLSSSSTSPLLSLTSPRKLHPPMSRGSGGPGRGSQTTPHFVYRLTYREGRHAVVPGWTRQRRSQW